MHTLAYLFISPHTYCTNDDIDDDIFKSFECRCDFYSLGRNNPINILTSCGAKDLEDNGNDSNIQNETDNDSISWEKDNL